MTRRLLTNDEIEYILDFIQESPYIPPETAKVVNNMIKNKFRKQLEKEEVYPNIIPKLKELIQDAYETTLIQAGESVGVVCAQSIGEKQTQCTLNSIDWMDKLLYIKSNIPIVQPIGQMIDNLLNENPQNITHIPENRTQYLPLPDGYSIPSTDENGMVSWYKIEAVTRHLPVGKLVKVITQSGRSVTATQSKSFLVWDGLKFNGVYGSDIKIGDILPTTKSLQKPSITQDYFDLTTIFPKNKYLYTTEIKKAINYQKNNGGLQGRTTGKFQKLNGIEYTVPYNRYDTMLANRKDYFLTCPEGLIYIHTSNAFVSHVPDKIPLDNDFGFFIGLYLADGWVTKTFLGISNNDKVIRKRITDFCDRYGVTYHTVFSEGKNVRNGTTTDLKVHSVLFARMFMELCNTGSSNKHIPDFAYIAPDDFIKGLIDGYFSGDGFVNKTDGSINASSVSEELITGISFILSYYDIFGIISSMQREKNNVGSKNIKKIYNLRISNGFAQNFAKEFSLTESKKQEKLHIITLTKDYRYENGRCQEEFPCRDVYFDKVISVEYVEGTTEYVYDLTVEKTRNFQLWNSLNLNDTFHKSGQSEKTMTHGVPRFQELINATKNPRNVNHKIYLKDGGKNTLEETREKVGSNIIGISFNEIAISIDVKLNKREEKWYETYKILYNDNFMNHKHCISIKLNKQKLYELKLSLEYIADYIHNEYDDLFCVFSPPGESQLDIFVDCSNIELPEERISFINEDNVEEIYLEECVQPILEKINFCGVEGISEIFFTEEKDEWIIETNGINSRNITSKYVNYKNILALDIVDNERTTSNNVWDIYEVLGIEATREFLIEEFMSIMEGINSCHACLLVDRMTFSGNIASITRYTMKKDESGPFGKASFEETMDNFLNAAAKGEIEPTKGVSASIICGKRANIGTGMVNVKIDITKLPLCKSINHNEINSRMKAKTLKRNKKINDNKIKKENDNDFESI